MKIFLFFITFFISEYALCQPANVINDLKTRMKTENDTARVITMNEIASIYGNKGLFDSCDYYFLQILELSQKINFPKGLCAAYNGLGIGKMVKGEYQPALEYYFKGLAVAESKGPFVYINLLKRNIVTVYLYQDKYKEAIPILNEVLKVVVEKKDSLKIFPILTEIGLCYAQQKIQDSAMFYYNKAIKICNAINAGSLTEDRYNQYLQAKSSVLPKVAIFFIEINKPAEALALLLPFWDQIKSTKNIYNQLTILSGICGSYLRANDYPKVIRYADIGILIDSSKEFPEDLKSLHLRKAEALYKLGKFKESYESHLAYSVLNDTVYNSEKFKAITEMQVKYDTEKKEQQISSLNKEKRTQKLIVWLAISGLLVAIGLLIFVIRSKRLQQKLLIKEKEIQKKELEQKMADLEQTALRAQMNPHFIFNCLNSVQRFIIGNDTEGANEYLSTFANLIRQTLENSGKKLIPLKDELRYLETYIKMEQLRSNNKFDYKISIGSEVDQTETYIPNMIVQPYVENSIHHGMIHTNNKKGFIKLDISQGNKLNFTIDDNGAGINNKNIIQSDRDAHHSMGGAITEKRIAMYNSLHEDKIELDVLDKADTVSQETGTTVILKFPLNN